MAIYTLQTLCIFEYVYRGQGSRKYFLSCILIFLTSICLIEGINIFSFKMRQIALITIWYRKIIYIIILLPLYQRRWSISHWQYFCEICRNYLKTKCNVKMHMIIIEIGWMSVLLHFISLSNNMSLCLS